MQVEGFGVDFVSWGHYRPSVWRNYWHSHSFYEVSVPRICRDEGVALLGAFRRTSASRRGCGLVGILDRGEKFAGHLIWL